MGWDGTGWVGNPSHATYTVMILSPQYARIEFANISSVILHHYDNKFLGRSSLFFSSTTKLLGKPRWLRQSLSDS